MTINDTMNDGFGGSMSHLDCDECMKAYESAVTTATVTGSIEATVTYDHRGDDGHLVVDHQARATRMTADSIIRPCGSIEPHATHRWATTDSGEPVMHTCPGIANDARRVRAVQFHDIDEKVARVRVLIDDIRKATAEYGPDDWGYTGRGSDLARIQHDLAVVLGEE